MLIYTYVFTLVDKGDVDIDLCRSGIFMFITLLIVGAMGAVSGQGDRFEPYLADHPSLGKAVAAMICLYGASILTHRLVLETVCSHFTFNLVFAFNLSWGPLAWVVAAEMSTGRNRQKHLSIGTAMFWVSAWVVTFTLPYLFQPDEAGLGPMIGFVSPSPFFFAYAFARMMLAAD